MRPNLIRKSRMLADINIKKQRLYKEIIRHLYFNKSLSCAELSYLIQKSVPLTTSYLNELIELNQVVETGYAASTGGRRPLIYSIKEGVLYTVAVAMDQLVTRIALLSSDNTIVGAVEKYDLPLANNPNSLAELIQHLHSFIAQSKIPQHQITGIGIGMPGFVDTARGINYTFLQTSKGTIVSIIEEALQIPVLIDNDSSLTALAELKWGEAKSKKHSLVVNIGWGVGLGIIADGKLFRGAEGFAGEFSHIPLFDNNKICSCGKHGCLETETSLVVIAEKGVEKLKTNSRPTIINNLDILHKKDAAKKIIAAAYKGDVFAIELLSDAAYHIGRGLAILIHVLNPELIVISGIGSAAGKVWIAPIQQAINEHCIPKISEKVSVLISQLGPDAELIGAAALVMENLEKGQLLIKENHLLYQ